MRLTITHRRGVASSVGLLLGLLGGCEQPASPAAVPSPPRTSAPHAVEPAPSYEALVESIDQERARLAGRLARASAPDEREVVIAEARAALSRALIDRLLPRWYGTPWAMNGTTDRPAEGAIACGYFVATILQDAGFSLHRTRFGQAAALRIQEATTPPERAVHRFFSIAPEQLADKIAALGDGVYIIGLNVHVGFVVVRDGEARLVHASYTDDRVVVDEALATARAIELSRPKGYFVSELLSTNAAVERWLERRPLQLPP
ncbi:MAG: hypothetical protein KC468_14440 [Myxococcales bacterium]|nr:hypothetical protein [Myxococcales bacterium]